MYCPFCQAIDTKVIDSRLVGDDGSQIRRRRECISCAERFTTYEIAELTMPRVIKRDGRRAPFDEEKLLTGMMRALEKRPVPVEKIDHALSAVIHQLRATGEREVLSSRIGEWVMTELRKLDQVAYVRFASVYRSFEDVEEFNQEINKLKTEDHEPKT